MTTGYGDIAQPKWAAWVRRWQMSEAVEVRLEDQLAAVAAFVDPVYPGNVVGDAVWDPGTFTWTA